MAVPGTNGVQDEILDTEKAEDKNSRVPNEDGSRFDLVYQEHQHCLENV